MLHRETLLGQLQEYLKEMKEDFSARSGQSAGSKKKPPKGKNLPEVVNDIVWARQLQNKVLCWLLVNAKLFTDTCKEELL